MKTRQISNKKNIILLLVGIVMASVCFIVTRINILHEKGEWLTGCIKTVVLVLGIVGLILIVINIINVLGNIKINKDLNNLAYGFDYQKEFSTYRIVGRDKAKAKNEAKKFHKYSEWRRDVENRFEKIINDEDAYHFMVRIYRDKESFKDLFMSVLIPLDVAIFTVLYSNGVNISETASVITIIIIIAILIVFATVGYFKCKEEIGFMTDFMEIVFPEWFSKK